jgi:hypothetical protein
MATLAQLASARSDALVNIAQLLEIIESDRGLPG